MNIKQMIRSRIYKYLIADVNPRHVLKTELQNVLQLFSVQLQSFNYSNTAYEHSLDQFSGLTTRVLQAQLRHGRSFSL